MDRTVYINIGGKEYPMRFSLGASKAISQKFGSMEKMADKMQGTDEVEAIDSIIWILELFIRQGCAYKNLFEKNVPASKNAPVDNGEYVPLNAEAIELGIDLMGLKDVKEKIYATITGGEYRKIDAEAKNDAEKNAETT